MNYKAIWYTIGRILLLVAALLAVPFLTSLFYGELGDSSQVIAYVVPALFLLALGYCFSKNKPEDNTFYSKEGFITVGVSWLLIILVGVFPYFVSTAGNALYDDLSFVDWIFESASGFTTTGATMLSAAQLDGLPHGLMMWRSLTQWIGGMGMLLFLLAILPSGGASSMHVYSAETTGVQPGKLVSKTTLNAKVLYLIYTALTVVEIITLAFSGFFEGGASVYESVLLAFGTMSSGGFSPVSSGVGGYNAYVQIVIFIFMLLAGINFTMFFLIITGRFKGVLKNEELRFYLILIAVVIIALGINMWLTMEEYSSFWNALPRAAFSAVSISSTTAFDATTAAGIAYSSWSDFARILFVIMAFVGGCAGSTAGGFKCSRILILLKSAYAKCRSMLNPNAVYTVKMDGKKMDDKFISGVNSYFVMYLMLVFVGTLLLTFDPSIASQADSVFASFSTTMCMFNNVSSELIVGTINGGYYAALSPAAKILESLMMVIGRLEIYPILLLFAPKTYSRKY